jgi:O-antigen/teichoic acid export membrane protein
VLATAIAAAGFFITAPITLGYLGESRFGLWMTIASFAGILSCLDLGLANALISEVARRRATLSDSQVIDFASNAICLLVVVAVGLLAALCFVLYIIPVERWYELPSTSGDNEFRSSVLVFLIIFAASVPLNGLSKIQHGLQAGWRVHLVRAAGSLVSIGAVVVASRVEASIPWLIAATFGIQTAALVFVSPKLIFRLLNGITWSRAIAMRTEAIGLLRTGSLFFALQAAGIFVTGADQLIASVLAGTAEAGVLAILIRIFQITTLPTAIANAPLWAAYADAAARHDTNYIRRTLIGAILKSFAYTLTTGLLLVLFMDRILVVWLDARISIPALTVSLYCAWSVCESAGNAVAMYMNGTAVLRLQLWILLCFLSVLVPLKVFWAPQFGLDGLIGANVLAYVLTVMLPYSVFLFFRLKQSSN